MQNYTLLAISCGENIVRGLVRTSFIQRLNNMLHLNQVTGECSRAAVVFTDFGLDVWQFGFQIFTSPLLHLVIWGLTRKENTNFSFHQRGLTHPRQSQVQLWNISGLKTINWTACPYRTDLGVWVVPSALQWAADSYTCWYSACPRLNEE